MCPEALEPLASFLELAQGAQNREHRAITCSWAPSEGEPEHAGSGNWTAPFPSGSIPFSGFLLLNHHCFAEVCLGKEKNVEYKDIPQRGVLNLLPLGTLLDPNPKYSPV